MDLGFWPSKFSFEIHLQICFLGFVVLSSSFFLLCFGSLPFRAILVVTEVVSSLERLISTFLNALVLNKG